MHKTKDIEENVERMCFPEILICMLPYDRMSKDENNAHDQEEEDSCDTCNRSKEPESDVRLVVRSKVNFSCETP